MLTTPEINEILRQAGFGHEKMLESRLQGGGSINNALVIYSTHKSFFLKFSSRPHSARMFETEKTGLETLRLNGSFKTPEVLGTGSLDDKSFLLLEYIEPGNPDRNFFSKLGKALARLHQQENETFGFHEDNFIGSLPQTNKTEKSWPEFFMKHRIQALGKKALSSGLLNETEFEKLNALGSHLQNICPPVKPSLLHGDLWAGNFLCSKTQEPVLIDPAVYYGNREADLAMSKLFGGFQTEFYTAYQNEFPMDEGWEERLEIWNLYPLLVHLLLFGSSYKGQILSVLKKYPN